MFSFFPNFRFFGLEIGSHSLRLAQVGGPAGVKIKAIYETQLTRNPWLKNGLRDNEEVADKISQGLALAKPHPIGLRQAVCSIPESSIFSKIIKLPKLSRRELIQAVPFEAADFLPLPLEEVYLDWELEETVNEADGKRSVHVTVVAAPRQLIDDLVKLTNQLGIRVLAIESEAWSIKRSLEDHLTPASVSILLNLGSRQTTIMLLNQRTVKFTTTVLVGSEKLRQSLVTNLPLIVDEVNESIKYYRNRLGESEPIKGMILTGQGAMIPALARECERLAKLPCAVGYPPISLPNRLPMHPRFAAVIGLARWRKAKS